jgi:hypothetical protein
MHEHLADQLEVKVYRECFGCGRCGRFGLSVESFHSENTQGHIKATCPWCAWTETRSMRAPRNADAKAADAKAAEPKAA